MNESPLSFDGTLLSQKRNLEVINGTERWYGTPYLATGISHEELRSLSDAGARMDSDWKFPGDNPFIPQDISLVGGDSDLNPSLVLSLSASSANPSESQVWHAADTSFGSPKQVRRC
jgi:secreted Zn-dependent insulinase-like peptidase